jgi:hypothetical protein
LQSVKQGRPPLLHQGKIIAVAKSHPLVVLSPGRMLRDLIAEILEEYFDLIITAPIVVGVTEKENVRHRRCNTAQG